MIPGKPWTDSYHVYVHIEGEDWDYCGGYDNVKDAEEVVKSYAKSGKEIRVRIESDTTWKMISIPKIKIKTRE